MSIPQLPIEHFDYDLPAGRIAKYPLANRNESKLLVYENGQISHRHFAELQEILPKPAALVLNDTKVVAARLKFKKDTGAEIEIFCLEPHETEINEAMQARGQAVWKCMVGNLKRFKPHDVLQKALPGGDLYARQLSKEGNVAIVHFEWNTNHAFSEILAQAGQIPLPPYLSRETEESDKERYQTVYAQDEGAVAAPTAGLHFTNRQLHELKSAGVDHHSVTLHVGAGTFKPVKAATLDQHDMHAEHIVVSRQCIEWLLKQPKVVAVGTTSLRSLESLYWLAIKTHKTGSLSTILQAHEPYELNPVLERNEALELLLNFLKQTGKNELKAQTALFTMPGYHFKMVDALITNFHQPRSTLLALIAAFIGPGWKKVYEEALARDYRFLSYGDSSLLIPQKW